MELTLPRGRLATSDSGTEEWRSTVVPRYQRRMREVNEAVAGVYLSGGNTRRIRGALRPLLKNAPLSKSAVSRIVGTLRGEWETWAFASCLGSGAFAITARIPSMFGAGSWPPAPEVGAEGCSPTESSPQAQSCALDARLGRCHRRARNSACDIQVLWSARAASGAS